MSFCFSVLKTQSIMYFLHSVSVSGFNSLTRHGLSHKQCCNKAWKPMIYKALHVPNCAGRSHLICWPWLSYVKFAQCAGVGKKSRAASLRVTFSHHYAVLFRVPTWGLVFFQVIASLCIVKGAHCKHQSQCVLPSELDTLAS